AMRLLVVDTDVGVDDAAAIAWLLSQTRYRDLAAAHPGATLVALGPLTNLALALERHPEAMWRFGRLVLLGGAWRGGNVTPVAEFNIWYDAEAAARVLDGGAADRSRHARRLPPVHPGACRPGDRGHAGPGRGPAARPRVRILPGGQGGR